MTFYLHTDVVLAMVGGTGNQSLASFVGASPLIRIYGGSVPADANASLSSNPQLAELVCASTPFSSFALALTNTVARATFGTIADDASADATGTATFFRLLKAGGTTVVGQGAVGTSAAELILNTTAITLGSIVSITSGYIDLPR